MPTLVVLAAGIGNRYGGLKQTDAVGPHGATIIDYAIFDAVQANFDKLVFIIRQVFEKAFREQLVRKFEQRAECQLVYQEIEVPYKEFQVSAERDKPWGTGHAVLAAKEAVEEPFAVINADDYYGRTSFEVISRYLTEQTDSASGDYAMVGYTLRNTLSEHGSVARGVCQANEAMYLSEILELTKIVKDGDGAYYLDDNGENHPLVGNEIVSMNFWGFTPVIFDQLEIGFRSFLGERGLDPKAEFYISSQIDEILRESGARVKILPTQENWFGLTYPGDKHPASSQIRELIEAGVYPERLWE